MRVAYGRGRNGTFGPAARVRLRIGRAKGKLRGKKPKLSDKRQRELRHMDDTGDYSVRDLAEVFSVSRPTICRTLERTSVES